MIDQELMRRQMAFTLNRLGSNGLGRQAEIIDSAGRRRATEYGPLGNFLGRTVFSD